MTGKRRRGLGERLTALFKRDCYRRLRHLTPYMNERQSRHAV
jgi:hypothetical protein